MTPHLPSHQHRSQETALKALLIATTSRHRRPLGLPLAVSCADDCAQEQHANIESSGTALAGNARKPLRGQVRRDGDPGVRLIGVRRTPEPSTPSCAQAGFA